MDITGSREQKHDGFTNWVLRASLANKHILEEKKKISVFYGTLLCGLVWFWGGCNFLSAPVASLIVFKGHFQWVIDTS